MSQVTETVEFTPLNGRCSCGKVKYQLQNTPLFTHVCHCTFCQRESGSAFALNAFVETHHVKLLEGETETVNIPTNSGGGQNIVRCPTCKIALWSHYSGAGDAICLLRIGTLDNPNAVKPDIHIFTSTKQDWLQFSDDIPNVEEYYKKEDYWPEESRDRFFKLMGRL